MAAASAAEDAAVKDAALVGRCARGGRGEASRRSPLSMAAARNAAAVDEAVDKPPLPAPAPAPAPRRLRMGLCARRDADSVRMGDEESPDDER